jgi:molybdopterin-containing oxidoreductase family iron-sulfur binding subunit
MDRRDFIKQSGTLLAGASGALSLPVLSSCTSEIPHGESLLEGRRMGMVIDLTRCREGCTACMDACREENNVAFHGDERWDVHWIRKVSIRPAEGGGEEGLQEKNVLLMCNHCDDPPCAQVCPVQATYKREDGIVLVDHHRCIGCRYCMIACPYNARYFNFLENEDWPNKEYPKRSHGVAESCNFCAHLVDQMQAPACVQACEATGAGALVFGDLNDPESRVARLVAEGSVKRIREDLGTEPKVYYIGL